MAEPKQPIKIVFSTDLYFGQTWYIKNDPDQDPYTLIDVKLSPGNTNKKREQIPAVKLRLQYIRTKVWVNDFDCSLEKDQMKALDKPKADDDD